MNADTKAAMIECLKKEQSFNCRCACEAYVDLQFKADTYMQRKYYIMHIQRYTDTAYLLGLAIDELSE